jgi:uncharacterized protein
MSVELRPLGVKCNIQCQYCYQNPQRDAGNVLHAYDIEKMKDSIVKEGGPFTMFGGEPLLVPNEILHELWSWGLEKFGTNGIQTNGTLVNDEHIEMFRKYQVHVGLSVDGPGELNDVRWFGNLERTRQATEKTHAAIARLCEEEIPFSLIVTLHRGNATADKLPVMHDWFRHLDQMGLTSARLHVLEVEDSAVAEKYALSTEQNLAAFLSFHELEKGLENLRLDVFADMRNLLVGNDDQSTCIWNACDSYTTSAVRGVEGNGQRSNCGRTNKDGIDFVKSDTPGFERYIALYYTPQEHGGCKDCRFFMMCKGQCPGTSIDGDWRNRSADCALWMDLFTKLEADLLESGDTPLSIHENRKPIEELLISNWMSGNNINIAGALRALSQQPADAGLQTQSRPHGDSHDDTFRHGDIPHGDHVDSFGSREVESNA